MAWYSKATTKAKQNGWEEIDGLLEDEEEESGAAWWIRIIICLIYGIAVFVFAWQTWSLVDTIFPSDNQFMKIATVCCLDVMSLIFAMSEMLYPFQSKHAKHLAFGMWLLTFAGALGASMIYMYLNSISVLHGVVNMSILVWAYAIVVLVMSADVLTITIGIRMEVGAVSANKRRARILRRQQAAQASVSVKQENSLPSAGIDMETLRLFAQVMQLQQGGGQTDQLPLARGTQHTSTGNTQKTPSARKAPQGASGTTQA